MTKFTARRLGSRWRVTGRSAASGISSLSSSTVNVLASQHHLFVGRHPDPDVGRAAFVAAAGARDPAQRHRPRRSRGQRLGGGGRLRPAPARACLWRQRVSSVPGAVGVHSDMRHLGRLDIAGGEYPVHLTVARRGGDGESRIAR